MPPEEWIFQDQYQGALHAKPLGEPYSHEIDEFAVVEHMEDVQRLANTSRGLLSGVQGRRTRHRSPDP